MRTSTEIVQYIRQRLGRELTEEEKARVAEELAYRDRDQAFLERMLKRDFVEALDRAAERGAPPPDIHRWDRIRAAEKGKG